MNKNLTVDFLSLIFSILLYTLSVIGVLYMSYRSSQALPDIKYTKDENAFMDVYMIDIDDSPTPISPKETADEVSTEVVKETKPAEEEKVKTTNKQTNLQEETIPPPPKTESKEEAKETPKEEPKPEPAPQEKPEPKPEKKEDPKPLSDLFSDVDTKKLDEVAKKEENAIQSSKKSDNETKGTTKKATSSQKTQTKGEVARGKSQRTGIYNKFIGEIDSTLTNIWSSYRAMPNQDATVEITINTSGKLSYKILELSYNTEFNQKLRDFLARVERMQFPVPPDGTPYTHKYKMKDLIR